MTLLGNSHLQAEVANLGAELVALRDAAGRDYLWNGDPAFWKGRAPLLFPIVGKVPDDRLLVGGKTYPMRQHGLARTSPFELIASDEASCSYRLDASDASRESYPFEFRLDVRYSLLGATLTIKAEVANRGNVPMPVSFGFHPALQWPLPGGGAKDEHAIIFSEPEEAPVRRLDGGLLRAAASANPVRRRHLALSEDLFREDVLVLDQVRSRSIEYRSSRGPAVRVSFPGMPHLGLWSKAGAGFLCIEPWQGYAAPKGFTGELAAKPGGIAIEAGRSRSFEMSLEVL